MYLYIIAIRLSECCDFDFLGRGLSSYVIRTSKRYTVMSYCRVYIKRACLFSIEIMQLDIVC